MLFCILKKEGKKKENTELNPVVLRAAETTIALKSDLHPEQGWREEYVLTERHQQHADCYGRPHLNGSDLPMSSCRPQMYQLES